MENGKSECIRSLAWTWKVVRELPFLIRCKFCRSKREVRYLPGTHSGKPAMRNAAGSFSSIGRFTLNAFALPFAIASVFYLSGCSTSLYLAKLGWGQAKILVHSRPNEVVLNDPAVKESIREKISLVMEVKIYGEKQIGLAKTSSFLRFYQVEGSYLLYVVSASPKDRLEAYQWWFPITGRVTTKGFFNYEDALRERRGLESKGLDVFIQGAQAYSTLGWLKDPIYSTMLSHDPAMVANVVIHELTHATVFFRNQLDFNEQIANFVGGQGAIDFTGAKFGEGSLLQKRAMGLLEDGVLFAKFMKGVYQKLNDLYSRPVSLAVKLQEREVVFLEMKEEFKCLKRQFKTDFYLGFEEVKLNNAVVLAFGRYIANIEQIRRVYEKLGKDLKRTVAFFKKIKKSGIKDPQDYVSRWLRERESEESISLGQDLPIGSSLISGHEKRVELILLILRQVDK